MISKIFRGLAWGALFFLSSYCVSFAAEPVNFLSDGKIENPSLWKLQMVTLAPSKDSQPARVEFLASTYGAFQRTLPISANWPRAMTLEITYRIKGAVPGKLSLTGRFLDGALKAMEKDCKAITLKVDVADWSTDKILLQIPENAKTIVVKVQGFRQGTVEISSIRLYAENFDAADAAVQGVALEDLIVKPSSADSRALAHVRFSRSVPFEFDSPFWKDIKKYPLKELPVRKLVPQEGDLDASFQVACDLEAIYVLMSAKDDTLDFSSRLLYERDCFEFYLNPTGANGKGGGYEFKDMHIMATVDPENNNSIVIGGGALGRSLGLEGKSRIVGNQFSVLLRLPYKTDGWNMSPFPGMRFTANVKYNDADSQPQEHIFSFSDDPNSVSWKDTSPFAPFEIVSTEALPYAPIILPYLAGSAAPVTANFKGYFNLERGDCSKGMDGFSFWNHSGWVHAAADPLEKWGGAPSLCLDSYKLVDDTPDRVILKSSLFNVQPGEKILVEFYAKYAGSGLPPTLADPRLHTRSSWDYAYPKFKPNVLTKEWKLYSTTVDVPKNFIGEKRQVTFWGSFNNMRGNKVWIADRKITRMTPIPLDVKLSTPAMFSHFDAEDQAKKLLIDFYHSGEPQPYFIQASIAKKSISGEDTGAPKSIAMWDLAMGKGESKSIAWPFQLTELGFFEATVSVYDKRDGMLLMQRNLAFTVSASLHGVVSPYFGLWMQGYRLPLYDSSGEFFRFIKKCGIADCHVGVVEEENTYTLASIPINGFKDLGFSVSAQIWEHRLKGKTSYLDQDSDSIYDRCFQVAKAFAGKIDSLSYANEPNLVNSWVTGVDAREWANTYRVAYNAFKNANPNGVVAFGDLNGIPVDYMKTYDSINGGYFNDGILRVHAYGYDYDKDAFEEILRDRSGLFELFPDAEVRDTESGLFTYNYLMLMNLAAKKPPTQMSAGITRHNFYQPEDLFHPYGDSSPLIPIVMFQTSFLNNAKPLGKFDAGNGVIGFLFQKQDTELAVFWSQTGKSQVSLPLRSDSIVYDQFGNTVTNGAVGLLQLNDTYVRYVQGIDGSALRNSNRFTAAFSRPLQKVDRSEFVTNPYLILEPFQGQFDREIVIGEKTVFTVVVRNDSDEDIPLTLAVNLTNGLTVAIEPETMTLPKHSKRNVALQVLANAQLNKYPLLIRGNTKKGKLVPLTLSVSTGKSISVAGYSRMVRVKNNSPEAQDAALAVTMFRHIIKPEGVTLKLKPDEVQSFPFSLATSMPKDVCELRLGIGVQSSKDAFKQFFSYYEAAAVQVNSDLSPKEVAWQYSIKPKDASEEGFMTDFSVQRVSNDVRFLVKIHDPSPVQSGELAEINSLGDCLVLGFDTGTLEDAALYGNDDFEIGCAVKPDGSIEAYRWNGRFGYESAVVAHEFVRSAVREGEYVIYDIRVPFAMLKIPSGRNDVGFSLRAINRTRNGKNEYCLFGDGLEKYRNISMFGILRFP